jgi:hypothetical protein
MAVNKNFVVKNGFEVNTDLIVADASSRKVGVASTNPQYLLDVRGGIGVTDIYSVGITTVLEEFNVGLGGTTFTIVGSGGPGGIGSIGVGTDGPQYLLHVAAPVSTGQTALYIKGDMFITGDIRGEDDLFLDEVVIRNLDVTGVSTIPQLVVTGLTSSISINAGFSTFREKVFLQKDLDVDGHSELDNVNISGIATIQFLDAQSLIISGIAATNISVAGNFKTVGISTFESYVDINDNLQVESIYATGVSTFTNYVFSDVQFTTSNLNVTGFSTFTQAMDVNGNIDVDGHTELDNVNISGIVTASSVNIDGGNIDGTTIGGSTRAAGNFTTLNANGNVTLGDATSDTITATGRFASDVTPSTSGTRSLGSSTLQWKDLYIDGHAEFDNINISGIVTTNNIKISGSIADTNNNVGTAGSILASDGSSWYWADPVSLASLAAGSDRQIQFNDGGSLGASFNLVYEVDGTLGNAGLVSATRFKSFVPTGSQPFECSSTTLNINLNADLLDNQQGSYYTNASNISSGTLNAARLPTDIVPSTDNTGNVGTSALTWSNGQFTNLTIDSTLTVTGTINVRTAIDLADSDILRFGTGDDWELYHNGTDNYMDLNVGDLIIRDNTTERVRIGRQSGIITATGFSAGGTSSQFLKADGSTDSVQYSSTGKAVAMAMVFG